MSGSTSAPASDDPAKRSAEECLCLLAVIDGLLRHLGGVEQEVLKQLMTDLLVLTNKHKSFQVRVGPLGFRGWYRRKSQLCGEVHDPGVLISFSICIMLFHSICLMNTVAAAC